MTIERDFRIDRQCLDVALGQMLEVVSNRGMAIEVYGTGADDVARQVELWCRSDVDSVRAATADWVYRGPNWLLGGTKKGESVACAGPVVGNYDVRLRIHVEESRHWWNILNRVRVKIDGGSYEPVGLFGMIAGVGNTLFGWWHRARVASKVFEFRLALRSV